MEKRTIAVICGSVSDIDQITEGLTVLRAAAARGDCTLLPLQICSAHRNPRQLRELLMEYATGTTRPDVVIMCAGKLAALFGECDALSRNDMRNDHMHFIAVPLHGKTEEATRAAYLSATEVPNAQFIFRDEFFRDPSVAFAYAVQGELPAVVLKEQKQPQTMSVTKAYHMGRRTYPSMASYDLIINTLECGGLIHAYTGKTRETFIDPLQPELLFILATDRISIFDIVLNSTIPDKGAVLTAMTVHWLDHVFADVPHHLVAYGAGIYDYLPQGVTRLMEGLGSDYLAKNMIVVKHTTVLKVEAIVRGYLTGSGLRDYKKIGVVCGITLPQGLIDGSELPEPIFTPSTKADYGEHDQNIDFDGAVRIIGAEEAHFVRDSALHLYTAARDRMRSAGIIIADTKFEFGVDANGDTLLIDEILTPDSSRFWPVDGRDHAMEKGDTPPSFDKEPIRIAGKQADVKNDRTWIPSTTLIAKTTESYRFMVERATGHTLEQFWKNVMNITL